MGASVAETALASGARVGWVSDGRSAATADRAERAGLEDLGTVRRLAEWCEVVISVCPPGRALDVARRVAGQGFRGLYVDANAVSPETARRIDGHLTEVGAVFVDGAIIGLPPTRPGTTRIYLAGGDADRVSVLLNGGLIEPVVMDGGPGAASALKVCYAAWTKGAAALQVAIRALAVAESVDETLLDEWSLSQPGLAERSEAAARKNAFKAWRFADEMLEIARSFESASLPGGFHGAAAEVYTRLAGYRDVDPPPRLDEVIDTVLGGGAVEEAPT